MPSSILIDFGGQRKVFEATDEPVPWTKVVEVAVGQAPTVDVIFKSETQEVRVKTFKFKTEKTRKVAITVAMDASNTITAKLVTLDTDTSASDNIKDEGEIVMLGSTGVRIFYTRDAKRIENASGKVDHVSVEEFKASAVDAASAVPPSRAKAVFIEAYMSPWKLRHELRQVVQGIGYTVAGIVDLRSQTLSTALYLAKPEIQYQEWVAVVQEDDALVNVCWKSDHCFHLFEMIECEELHTLYPNVKEVIVICDNTTESTKEKYNLIFAQFPVKFVEFDAHFQLRYLWNLVDDGNMDGYFVPVTTQCIFRFKYSWDFQVDARLSLFPWEKTMELDVGESPTFDVFMWYELGGAVGEELVKQFKFKTKKNRKVCISITMDDARVPNVSLITV